MDDLMEKLKNVLGDKESIDKLRKVLDIFSAENAKPSAHSGENTDTGFEALLKNLSRTAASQAEPEKPEPAPDASAGGDAEPELDIDFEKIFKMTEIFGQAKKPDKNTELMLALRPMLKEESQLKVDRVIKLFRLMAMYPLIKESGLLGGDFLGIL
ncbi:MAG: hypothetical protein QM689_13160 [Oscillospiraceae bacterium]